MNEKRYEGISDWQRGLLLALEEEGYTVYERPLSAEPDRGDLVIGQRAFEVKSKEGHRVNVTDWCDLQAQVGSDG